MAECINSSMTEYITRSVAREVLAHGVELHEHAATVYEDLGVDALRYTFVTPDAYWYSDADSLGRQTEIYGAIEPIRSKLAVVRNSISAAFGRNAVAGMGISYDRDTFDGERHTLLANRQPHEGDLLQHLKSPGGSSYPYDLFIYLRTPDAYGRYRLDKVADAEAQQSLIENFMNVTEDDLLVGSDWPSEEYAAEVGQRMVSATANLAAEHDVATYSGNKFLVPLQGGLTAGFKAQIIEDPRSGTYELNEFDVFYSIGESRYPILTLSAMNRPGDTTVTLLGMAHTVDPLSQTPLRINLNRLQTDHVVAEMTRLSLECGISYVGNSDTIQPTAANAPRFDLESLDIDNLA